MPPLLSFDIFTFSYSREESECWFPLDLEVRKNVPDGPKMYTLYSTHSMLNEKGQLTTWWLFKKALGYRNLYWILVMLPVTPYETLKRDNGNASL